MSLSHRQARAARKRILKPSRYAKPDGATVTSPRLVAEAVEIAADRDGLDWLVNRNRLSPRQVAEARAYRRDFQDAASAGPMVKSSLNIIEGGAGAPGLGQMTGVVDALDAQRALFRKRFVVLRGQADLLEVLDGVCGRRLTLRTLAGGDASKTKVLEAVLKVALDQLATYREEVGVDKG